MGLAAMIVLTAGLFIAGVADTAVAEDAFSISRSSTDLTNTGQGTLRTPVKRDGEILFLDLPLEHTSVNAWISGFLARVDVTQTFTNTQDDTIEAVYVFPLPDNAAVDAMTMTIGDRTIKGIIKKRDEAQAIYEQARTNGQTAALLTQERPNIFTQSVANILPGDRIEVRISYVQDLKYDHGEYEFNFPMVVGPRFIPGAPTGRSGGGWSPDSTKVPDASRITPPVLRPDQRSGHDIDVTLHVYAGVPVENLYSPSHRIIQEPDVDNTVTITLDPADTLPNKDFIVRYDVTGKQPEAALLTHRGDNGGFFTLMIQPQGDFDIGEVTSKEMVFVVDCSGSMSGAPMAQAKALMRKAIGEMNPGDSFQIIRFSSAASQFSPLPLPNTPANVQKGLAYIDAMSGGGGTMMIEGIKASLVYPPDPNRLRMVLFLTDGYIGNEQEILGAIEEKIGGARLFSLGVGSSVNHYLLDRMAGAGRGFVQYIRPDEDTQPAVDLFYSRIRNPLITDIRVDWGGLDVSDVYPGLIPDLFSEQPVILHGRYDSPGRGTVTISGKMAGQSWEQEIDVNLPADEPANDVLATLWARTRIKSLMDRMNRGHRDDIEKEITDLALKFRLMSQYTAFVAVTEEIRRDPDGTVRTVNVPVEMPEFVEYEGVFGDADECFDMAMAPGAKKGQVIGRMKSATVCCREAPAPQGSGASFTEPKPLSHDRRNETASGTTEAQEERKRCGTMTLTVTVRSTSGDVTDTEVHTALIELRQELEALFNREGGRGDITVRITWTPAGAVKDIEILKNTMGSTTIETSLTRLLKKRLTGLSGGEAAVTLTFN